MKFKTISDLHKAVKSGLVDESKLQIVLDNDSTGFYISNGKSDTKITVQNANGYNDILELYTLLFPNAAEIDWC